MDFFDHRPWIAFLLYFQLYIRFAVHNFRTTGDLSCFGPWYVKVTQVPMVLILHSLIFR
jgi:hypothetical protein